jgi:hypothetical protein
VPTRAAGVPGRELGGERGPGRVVEVGPPAQGRQPLRQARAPAAPPTPSRAPGAGPGPRLDGRAQPATAAAQRRARRPRSAGAGRRRGEGRVGPPGEDPAVRRADAPRRGRTGRGAGVTHGAGGGIAAGRRSRRTPWRRGSARHRPGPRVAGERRRALAGSLGRQPGERRALRGASRAGEPAVRRPERHQTPLEASTSATRSWIRPWRRQSSSCAGSSRRPRIDPGSAASAEPGRCRGARRGRRGVAAHLVPPRPSEAGGPAGPEADADRHRAARGLGEPASRGARERAAVRRRPTRSRAQVERLGGPGRPLRPPPSRPAGPPATGPPGAAPRGRRPSRRHSTPMPSGGGSWGAR